MGGGRGWDEWTGYLSRRTFLDKNLSDMVVVVVVLVMVGGGWWWWWPAQRERDHSTAARVEGWKGGRPGVGGYSF